MKRGRTEPEEEQLFTRRPSELAVSEQTAIEEEISALRNSIRRAEALLQDLRARLSLAEDRLAEAKDEIRDPQ